MSQQLNLFQNSATSILLRSASRAKIFQLLAKGKGLTEQEVACFMRQHELSGKQNQHILSLRMLKDCSHTTMGGLLKRSCKKLPTLGFMTANGNLLIQSGFYPKIENVFTLSDILEENPDQKYFLSQQVLSRLLGYQDSMLTPLLQGTEQESVTERMLLRVNSYRKPKEIRKGQE